MLKVVAFNMYHAFKGTCGHVLIGDSYYQVVLDAML